MELLFCVAVGSRQTDSDVVLIITTDVGALGSQVTSGFNHAIQSNKIMIADVVPTPFVNVPFSNVVDCQLFTVGGAGAVNCDPLWFKIHQGHDHPSRCRLSLH